MKPNPGRLRCNPWSFKAGRQIGSAQPIYRIPDCTWGNTLSHANAYRRAALSVHSAEPISTWNRKNLEADVTCDYGRTRTKEAPPPRAGKSSPSLRFAAGLRFASHFPLRSKCGWSPLSCLCYPLSLAGKAGVQLRSTLLSKKAKPKIPVDRSSLLIEGVALRNPNTTSERTKTNDHQSSNDRRIRRQGCPE